MIDKSSPALQVAMAYYEAWTSKDVDRAMAYIAEDIVCEAPAGRIDGAEAYRAFIGPFAQMLISASVIGAYGDQEQALIMYDTATTLVANAPGAECVTVQNGKITYSRFLFDRLPFEIARQAMS
jgi:ketosteroid isomerase-like protein